MQTPVGIPRMQNLARSRIDHHGRIFRCRQSRNRTFGSMMGKGYSVISAQIEMNMVAEGVKSVPAVMELAEAHDITMPIAYEVHRVIRGEGTPSQAFRGLLRQASGAESDPG